MTTNQAAIESLRLFAGAHGEGASFHLCTAALSGEAWAIDRVTRAIAQMPSVRCGVTPEAALKIFAVIRVTDTTRPDGAIARGLVSP